ncbi:hypothetical protein DFH07DRAFT_702926, partial [Mycena maculata]
MAEEDIDNETIQAQIDLSLSFAQSLVSSWVKPALEPTKNSSRAFEAELKEYMRRPPRLGVGAPIPEVASSSRETERLKSHLSGKGNKRGRGEADDAGPKELSDNEEESRGAFTKKKARVDPFDAHSKKKKKGNNGLPTPRVTPLPEEKSVVKESPVAKAVSEDVATPSEPLSPSKRRKKKKHKNRDHESGTELDSMAGPSAVPADILNNRVTPSQAIEVIDISLVSTPPVSPISPTRRPQSAPLKGLILNLTGPQTDDESGEEGELGTPSASPKKKRKRKKKK